MKHLIKWLFPPIVSGDIWVRKGYQNITVEIVSTTENWVQVHKRLVRYPYLSISYWDDIHKWELYWKFRKQ